MTNFLLSGSSKFELRCDTTYSHTDAGIHFDGLKDVAVKET